MRREFFGVRNYFDEPTMPYFGEDSVFGRTVYWAGSDSLGNFRSNPKPGYTEHSITYSFNRHGYRTADFDFDSPDPVTLCLGCSHTMGIGHRQDHCWPGLLSSHFTDKKIYNLGQGGTSGSTVSRILANAVKFFNIAEVFILWPSLARFETAKEDWSIESHGPWSYGAAVDFLYNHAQAQYQYQKNSLLVELLAHKHQFRVFALTQEQIWSDAFQRLAAVEPARDIHFSRAQHRFIFDAFLKVYHDQFAV